MEGGEESRSIRRTPFSVSQCSPTVSHGLGWEAGECSVVLRHRGNVTRSRNTQLRAISRHRLPCWDCMEPILRSLMLPHALLRNSNNRPAPECSRPSGWLWQGYWSPTFEWGHCRHF